MRETARPFAIEPTRPPEGREWGLYKILELLEKTGLTVPLGTTGIFSFAVSTLFVTKTNFPIFWGCGFGVVGIFVEMLYITTTHGNTQ